MKKLFLLLEHDEVLETASTNRKLVWTCPVWGMTDLGCLWNTWSEEQRTELAVDINLEAVGMYEWWLALRLT